MSLLEIWIGTALFLIALLFFLALLDGYREVRRQELAQRGVRRRHDQYLADARERARLVEERESER